MIFKKISSLYNRIKSNDVVFFEEQFMYGHRESILSFFKKINTSLTNQHILSGSIDHGWAYDENLWLLRKRNLQLADRYVWNSRHSKLLKNKAKTIPVGSPWLYMLANLDINPKNVLEKLPKTNKVVIFPSHNLSYSNLNIIDAIEGYEKHINENSNVVVCLFWLDFCDPKNIKYFEAKGWKVECAGYTTRPANPKDNVGGRPNFLLELFEILKDADLFITSDAGTGMFYAMSLGAKIQYLPNVHSLKHLDDQRIYKEVKIDGFFETGFDWVNYYFPELIDTKVSPRNFIDKSWDELGYQDFLKNISNSRIKWIKRDTGESAMEIYSTRLNEIRKTLESKEI